MKADNNYSNSSSSTSEAKIGKSDFTKDADRAFDEFCKKYLNSNNGFLTNFYSTNDNKSKKTAQRSDRINENANKNNNIVHYSQSNNHNSNHFNTIISGTSR